MSTSTISRTVSPLLGWLICMLAAAGVFAVAVWVDLRCQDTAGVWAWSLVEIALTGAAAVLIIWAIRWHGRRWLLLLVPLAAVTLATFAFVLWEAWGVTTNCNVAYLDIGEAVFVSLIDDFGEAGVDPGFVVGD